METLSSSTLGLLIPIILAVFVIFLRMKRAKRPVSAKSIILPPFFMATGFAMFLFPGTLTSPAIDLTAFLAGIVLSIPLILTSRFEIVGEDIYLKPSKALFFILGGLLVVRLIVKLLINDSFTALQTAGLFFLLAFGMLATWRVAMLYMYRQVTKKALRT
ncbi:MULTISPECIES: cytochrome c biogenesis protein CcdC [Brevibacillus]|uniref:Cytochrome c biogenesis protein CcdC n=1 Tax=Brevibacillus invocatus TaxID=173959 RepID=A0A3M8C985_9BACL|nr:MULTISPECIES: cytochrome c biogenesis protein CcdC [Brevibacillus]MCM3079929.1 cytochrome c biogenesis protein CcdC [Brevibacillus invocatus]MCM3430122.1 cytochrome c biogenesis protein CcdC [Brevibacillus invocatus]MDH4616678.1 cytochrome c biogenesis protein CcdC [Brevibacillus sp. AY1]RNB72270.1 cytochrome c biogenesis protein CcdC [Brevibacillus invocatus]